MHWVLLAPCRSTALTLFHSRVSPPLPSPPSSLLRLDASRRAADLTQRRSAQRAAVSWSKTSKWEVFLSQQSRMELLSHSPLSPSSGQRRPWRVMWFYITREHSADYAKRKVVGHDSKSRTTSLSRLEFRRDFKTRMSQEINTFQILQDMTVQATGSLDNVTVWVWVMLCHPRWEGRKNSRQLIFRQDSHEERTIPSSYGHNLWVNNVLLKIQSMGELHWAASSKTNTKAQSEFKLNLMLSNTIEFNPTWHEEGVGECRHRRATSSQGHEEAPTVSDTSN